MCDPLTLPLPPGVIPMLTNIIELFIKLCALLPILYVHFRIQFLEFHKYLGGEISPFAVGSPSAPSLHDVDPLFCLSHIESSLTSRLGSPNYSFPGDDKASCCTKRSI